MSDPNNSRLKYLVRITHLSHFVPNSQKKTAKMIPMSMAEPGFTEAPLATFEFDDDFEDNNSVVVAVRHVDDDDDDDEDDNDDYDNGGRRTVIKE